MKLTHFEQMQTYIPGLLQKKIIDIGSGKGGYILDALSHGANVQGLEYNQEYIDIAKNELKNHGFDAQIVHGAGEDMPFSGESFDVANLGEVIEHVQDPMQVLKELYRVLREGGMAYMSVPNRYSVKDTHFHLYFVNWVPRKFASKYISIFGRHKKYSTEAGRQKLDEMHYFTYRQIKKICEQTGFMITDIREMKLRKKFKKKSTKFFITLLYKPLRFFYFNTSHLLLEK